MGWLFQVMVGGVLFRNSVFGEAVFALRLVSVVSVFVAFGVWPVENGWLPHGKQPHQYPYHTAIEGHRAGRPCVRQ